MLVNHDSSSPGRGQRRRVGALLTAVLVMALAVLHASGAATAAPVSTPSERATFGIGPAAIGTYQRPFFSLVSGPGGSFRDDAAVVNYSAQPLALSVYPADMENAADGSIAVNTNDAPQTDAGGWVRLSSSVVKVVVPAASGTKPGIVKVPFRIVVPDTAEPGDHAAALVAVLSTLGKNPKGENVRLNQRVATRIYVRVNGALSPQLSVSGLRTQYHDSLNPFGRGSATVRFTVRNIGNVRLSGKEIVAISGMFGSGATKQTLPQLSMLFPGGAQEVSVRVAGVLPTVLQKTRVTVEPLLYQDEKPMPVPTARASRSFIAVPWSFLGLLVALGALAFFVRWLRRRPRRQSKHAKVRTPKGSPRNGTAGRTDGSPDKAQPERAAQPTTSVLTRSSRAVRATMVTATALILALVSSGTAHAAGVPFTDPAAQGWVGLCDAQGRQITSGSITSHPFAAYAVSSTASPSGYGVKDLGKAALYAFRPRQGDDPVDWLGQSLLFSSVFTSDAHPMAAGTVGDYSMKDFTSFFPLMWDGLVQLRMYYGSPGKPQLTDTYPAAVIRVTGSTWQVVSGGTVDCTAGKATSVEEIMHTVPTPSAKKPSSASTSSPSRAHATPGASSGAGAVSGASPGTSTPDGSKPASAAASAVRTAGGSSAPLVIAGIAAFAALGGLALWARRRSS